MRRIEFKKFAGVRKRGELIKPRPDFEDSSHLDRALWLIAEVESGGKYGCALNYDGTAMTAGIHQAIAVYPRALDDGKRANDQGPLWDLMARCDRTEYWMDAILQRLRDRGWSIFPDGKLRDITSGRLVRGQDIRHELSGAKNGCMPRRGQDRQRAEKYVGLFHNAFSRPETFEHQDDHGKRFILKRAERWGVPVVDSYSIGTDLARAIFWCNAVNAPAIARKKFNRFPSVYDSQRLMRSLANSNWGRWNDEIKGGRWQRTRRAAMKLWPKELFNPGGIMPKEYR